MGSGPKYCWSNRVCRPCLAIIHRLAKPTIQPQHWNADERRSHGPTSGG
ncbi:hypothetical protein L916_00363 [Phytophthora nicotianae]|uniref:Uncharacterized protein n=1 Tax=Phytophthora nicotianae TaxID=4792 RepID=W2JVH8_PHYNI|nr:hypothetical protein L916_00363 [Phytophthora nicotianae]